MIRLVGSSCLAWRSPCIRSFAIAATKLVRCTPAANGESSAGQSITALDIASRVNKLKRLHQTGGPSGKKNLELAAWKELNTLTEEQINSAEGKAVALLLNSWAYFAKHWERGKDGPITAADAQNGQEKSSDSN